MATRASFLYTLCVLLSGFIAALLLSLKAVVVAVVMIGIDLRRSQHGDQKQTHRNLHRPGLVVSAFWNMTGDCMTKSVNESP